MFDKIKKLISYVYVDKYIKEKKYDVALEKLNELTDSDFRLADTLLKRGKLCEILLMNEDAYSDFTYIIENCAKKQNAYFERMKLNYESGNYFEAITDASAVLEVQPENEEARRYKFLSFANAGQPELAKSYLIDYIEGNKYRAIHFILNETAKHVAEDELSRALKILEVFEKLEPENPLKIFNEAKIYGLAGQKDKETELLNKLELVFPKYFISHFRFTDMYAERDFAQICFLLELSVFDRQKCFAYPMYILEGYKCQMEGHIIDSKEAFENAIKVNPEKPEAYVLLAQTLQLMSGYDNPSYKLEVEHNYKKAMDIYKKENLTAKSEDMRKQIKHLHSTLSFK